MTLTTPLGSLIEPKKDYVGLPSDYDIDHSTIKIESGSFELHAWLSKADENSNNLIILAYGDYGNMSYYLSYIKFYVSQGFDVLSFDYRGFGKSDHFNIDKDYLFYNEFTTDLINVINYSKKNYNYERIGVLGLSMGSIMTIKSDEQAPVDFMIIDGSVYSINDVLLRLNDPAVKLPDEGNNEKKLEILWGNYKNKLLIHGASDDKITTLTDSKNIENQDKLNRRLYSYSGNHLGFIKSNPNKKEYKNYLNWLIN